MNLINLKQKRVLKNNAIPHLSFCTPIFLISEVITNKSVLFSLSNRHNDEESVHDNFRHLCAEVQRHTNTLIN